LGQIQEVELVSNQPDIVNKNLPAPIRKSRLPTGDWLSNLVSEEMAATVEGLNQALR
jgi:hypothetical protein